MLNSSRDVWSRDVWLDRSAIHTHQPGLSPEVSGGRWYRQDGQVDNRWLAKALLAAVHDRGVEVWEGVTVEQVLTQGTGRSGCGLRRGELQAEHYVLATGAWSQELLPIPVTPRKGQMLAVQAPIDQPLPLQTVLFWKRKSILCRAGMAGS